MLAAGGDASGPVFLLDGAVLSLYPQTAPAVRSLPSMFVYAGGVSAGPAFTPSASVLTAPEVTSYASSVLYSPLELTVTDTFGLGHGARVDMSAKGLLGSTPTQSMVLPGQTGAQQFAGGSHGGSGGPGSPGGTWTRADLTAAGSSFDSIEDPSLPGGGGGFASGFTPGPGGTGGGVVRLLAPGATLHLAGAVVADGGNGPGDGSAGSIFGPGGAGGTVRIVAGRVEGTGRVSASGGRGTHGFYTAGGGGGRVALSFADPPAPALALAVSATGGLNSLPPDANAQQLAGAGTVHLEELDALGVPKGPGTLIVTNLPGKPAWPTPLAGELRFATVEGRGSARLVAADDLLLGAVDPPSVNDRSKVTLDGDARLLLRTEGPQIALTATPDGGNVTVESDAHADVDRHGPPRDPGRDEGLLAAGVRHDGLRRGAALGHAGRHAAHPHGSGRAAAGPDHIHGRRDGPRGKARHRPEDVERPRGHDAARRQRVRARRGRRLPSRPDGFGDGDGHRRRRPREREGPRGRADVHAHGAGSGIRVRVRRAGEPRRAA